MLSALRLGPSRSLRSAPNVKLRLLLDRGEPGVCVLVEPGELNCEADTAHRVDHCSLHCNVARGQLDRGRQFCALRRNRRTDVDETLTFLTIHDESCALLRAFTAVSGLLAARAPSGSSGRSVG